MQDDDRYFHGRVRCMSIYSGVVGYNCMYYATMPYCDDMWILHNGHVTWSLGESWKDVCDWIEKNTVECLMYICSKARSSVHVSLNHGHVLPDCATSEKRATKIPCYHYIWLEMHTSSYYSTYIKKLRQFSVFLFALFHVSVTLSNVHLQLESRCATLSPRSVTFYKVAESSSPKRDSMTVALKKM